jgi:hypothetical protein
VSYHTIYSAGLDNPEQGSGTKVTFQRSDDCGATWSGMALPKLAGVVYTSNVQILSVFANPINPKVAFLTIQTNIIIGAPACQKPANSADVALESALICQLQFVTKDGGVTWQPLNLPAPGVLGEISPELNASLGLLGNVRAQGNRLYGVVTDTTLGVSGIVPPGRLVASDDSGLTWNLADGALSSQGLAVWDFAPTPSGSTVYVTAEPINDPARQPPGYGATLSIWRSADGGVTWARAGEAPGSTSGRLVEGMIAALSSSGRHAVYLMTGDKAGRAILGSADDGVTWQGDSNLSFPDRPGEMLGLPTFVGTLPDGSAVVVNPYGGAPIMAWSPGGAAPRAIAEGTALFPYWSPVFQQRAGDVYMWLMGQQGGGTDLLIRYTKLLLS